MTSTSNSGSDAVARYQYLLRTASPDQIEQAHEQAFAQMTAQERQEVLTALSKTSEVPADSSAQSLARSATRLEVQQPGALQNILGQAQSAIGSTTGKNLLTSIAGGFIGSGLFSAVTGGDGLGGRPGLLARMLSGNSFGRRSLGGVYGPPMGGGFGGNGGGMFGNGGGLFGNGGGLFGGIGQMFNRGGGGGFGGGPGGGPGGGGFGGPGGGPGGGGFGGGPGGGPGGGGPGGPGGF